MMFYRNKYQKVLGIGSFLMFVMCVYHASFDNNEQIVFVESVPERRPQPSRNQSKSLLISSKEVNESKQPFPSPSTARIPSNSNIPEDPLAPLIRQSTSLLDNLVQTNAGDSLKQNYFELKSMLALWNPEASQWATKWSKRYRQMLDQLLGPWTLPRANDETLTRITSVVEQCKCSRTIWARSNQEDQHREGSTCSQHAFDRGPFQKVVGFTFYGNPKSKLGKSRKYFRGIEENLHDLPHFYPNWTLRLYYDLEANHTLMADLCALACSNEHIDLCYVRNLPSDGDIAKVFAMNWRFYPIKDPQVQSYVSRDLDSRFSEREKAAIVEWEQSSHAFHFMRDHPSHSIEVLGSGWGVRLGPMERVMMTEAFRQAQRDPIFWASRKAYGPDQGFLKRYLWPWGKWNAITHDSYTCLQFPRTSPFPTQRQMRPNNYIASVHESHDILRIECPSKCRPQAHPDWKYC
ncbi:hypothetical protein TCAL_05903 [Tigriopus californicus]|uniref:Uncharacterized protein n=2 Tax=Tigriopus californicus TaxID=6832 RepID=A0A553PPJ7_TIGCA|nr:hypothetical protein TCAL_05903 [Tigriopus californicus]